MIIRHRQTANFTTITNRLFDDNRLQADEIGILAFLISRPDNWEVRRPALQRRFGIGQVAMKRIMRNWMKAGWCQATKVRLPNGRFAVLYDILDAPGVEMNDEAVTEALSLVSSEVSDGETSSTAMRGDDDEGDESPVDGQPPDGSPGGGDMGVAIYNDITNTDLTNTQNQNSERELARAREKHALNLAEFKRRYPTAASDDQGKIDEAWFALEFDEAEPALAGIVPFLEKLKRDKRTTVPAAWKYLKEKRWTLLEQAQAVSAPSGYPRDGAEGKAIANLYTLAGALEFFVKYVRKNDAVYYRHPVTTQLVALAQAPPRDEWVVCNRNQAGAWEAILRQYPTIDRRHHFHEGATAPWPWPPSAEGKLYTASTDPPPDQLMTTEDYADLK